MRRRIVAGCSRGGGVGLEGGGGGAGVEVWGADLDAVAASVLHERLRRVAAPLLGVEQCGAEGCRDPALQPRSEKCRVGKGFVRTFYSWWSAYHYKKKQQITT